MSKTKMQVSSELEVSPEVRRIYEGIAARAHASKDKHDFIMMAIFDELETNAELMADLIIKVVEDPQNAEAIKVQFVTELVEGIMEVMSDGEDTT